MEIDLLFDVAVAVGLGLLVGLQRQWGVDEVAGIRTFTLITVFGAVLGHLSAVYGGWVFAVGLVGVVALIVMGNVFRLRMGKTDTGITTEVSALLMFAVGGILAAGLTVAAIVTTGALAVLLHWKEPLHTFSERMGEADLRAVIRMALIGLVILPVLPDHAYGPYEVLNPFRIWLMVVLIVGISMGGYVAYKLFGARGGTLAAGVLGGLISSTATTVSYARRTATQGRRTPAAAAVIMLASTVVFGRVLVEIAVVAPGTLARTGPPLAAMMGFMLLVAWATYAAGPSGEDTELEERDPPSELGPAITFGLLYAAVLLAVAAARTHFGEGALFGVAAVSGLTDMDAITLSTAQLVKTGQLDAASGWRVILVGGMANLVFKGGAVAVLGSRALLLRVAVVFGISLAGGVALLALWPG
ncbi:MAG TPA: MgtC/SapB family protein [Longimicrobiales bacterium]|nr:MgtC/SapB family protein [Longimicrobiales bacterium]